MNEKVNKENFVEFAKKPSIKRLISDISSGMSNMSLVETKAVKRRLCDIADSDDGEDDVIEVPPQKKKKSKKH